MSVLGIISEYNPFHNGHKYHIEQSKIATGSDSVIVVMSGSFVQRGEPAFLDKWSRASDAVNNGVDLVIELPCIYSSQRGESFATGAVELMNSLGVVDYLSFGIESQDIETLYEIAQVLTSKPEKYISSVNEYIKENFSFPIARSYAIADYFNDKSLIEVLNSSNNILAIEYLKCLITLNSSIKPIGINRLGANYNSIDMDSKFMSATGIRHSVLEGHISSIEAFIPDSTITTLKKFTSKYQYFNTLENYEDIIIYTLRFKNYKNIVDSTPDLLNRIKNNSIKYNSLNEIIKNSISKIHTESRIKRVILHILLDLNKKNFDHFHSLSPIYIRILASNKKGLELLKLIKERSNLHIINKFSHYTKFQDESLNSLLAIEKSSTDLFYFGLKNKEYNMDYTNSPYIKNI